MSDPRKDLPAVSAPNFQERLRETVQTYLGNRGNPLDRGVILRDLVDSGLASLRPGYRPGAGGNPILGPGTNTGGASEYVPDLTPPPTPTGFKAEGAITHVLISHDDPVFQMGHGYLRTNVYGTIRDPNKPPPTFANAVPATQFVGTIFGMASNPATTWHLWIKWETNDNIESISPAGGTNGVVVRTGEDVALLLAALNGKITRSQLFEDLGAPIDLITGSGPDSFTARIASVAQAVNGEGNQCVNSDFSEGLANWTFNEGPNTRMGHNLPGWTTPPGTAYIEEIGYTSPLTYTEVHALPFGVVAGQRYEWSAYTGAHRARVAVFIYWLNSAGAIIGNGQVRFNDEEMAGGLTIETFKRVGGIDTAPAGATKAWGMIRKERTKRTETSSYAFFTRAYFAAAKAGQTELSPYTPTSSQRGLMGQYTFKIDLNGYVTGYGLASSIVNGAPESAFAVRADMFYIASPGGPGINPVTPFTVVTVPTVINGVDVPVGVYMDAVYIKNGTFNGAKIARLTVDDGAIVTLGVSKLTAGSLRIGSHISSSNYLPGGVTGFAIWADGNAAFNNVTMRGVIYALAGQIGGCNIIDSGITSTDWNGISGPTGTGWAMVKDGNVYFNNIYARGQFNSGSYTGYGWPTDGGNGAHLSGQGLLIGNALTGLYWQFTANGALYSPYLNVDSSGARFTGTLIAPTINGGSINGTTGTFEGSLSAAFAQVGTLNIGDDQVTVPRAASGLTTASVTMNVMAGKPVYLHGYSAGYTSTGLTAPGFINVGLKVNGAYQQQDVARVTAFQTDPVLPGSVASVGILFVHYPATSGACTYTFEGAGSAQGGGTFIFAMQAKK